MHQPNNTSTQSNPVGRFMVAVGAVIEHEPTGTILLAQRSNKLDFQPGMWELCYGRIAQFETPQQGLQREIAEELGITDLRIKEILSVWHIFRGPEIADNELVGITFHCTTQSQEVTLSDEHEAFAWMKPEQALLKVSEEGIKRDIEQFMLTH